MSLTTVDAAGETLDADSQGETPAGVFGELSLGPQEWPNVMPGNGVPSEIEVKDGVGPAPEMEPLHEPLGHGCHCAGGRGAAGERWSGSG